MGLKNGRFSRSKEKALGVGQSDAETRLMRLEKPAGLALIREPVTPLAIRPTDNQYRRTQCSLAKNRFTS